MSCVAVVVCTEMLRESLGDLGLCTDDLFQSCLWWERLLISLLLVTVFSDLLGRVACLSTWNECCGQRSLLVSFLSQPGSGRSSRHALVTISS